ncbi:alpha-mannosidase [Saccharopolyspora kobensis]|uniref:Alpha-mannosidase n=3 Tax=Saccharopolyspora kobensis TaxID=146035 RepID=A0A1H5WI85_9PSEU|nr:glycoside hydrolase family 38 C-terminal domain-containing protein [Saccharopolyspora kobensis]SEF99028.1 alpha-mannosidase [Saccharopolyspora kobensis]SFD75917.1 alpha-mannosidase [Saccharopolyspora kobensis]
MHDDRHIVEQRLDRVLAERLRPAQHSHTAACDIAVWHVPGEPVPVAEALRADYTPTTVGQPWGPAWGTSWFRITATVPEQWDGRTAEVLVDLGFDDDRPGFQCEGLAHTPDGTPIKGLHPRNTYLPLGRNSAGKTRTFYVEAAANPIILGPHGFQPTELGERPTEPGPPLYVLRRAEAAVLDEEVWNLVQDTEVLNGLMRELPTDSPRRHEILRALERMLDRLDLHDVAATAPAARAELTDVLARPAHASAHTLSAVGHAHIDSAWLWPLRETVRKVARTTANVTALMATHPDFHFAMSQAQQLAWVKQHHPQLHDRVRAFIHTGQFVPVGGMWVESDTNMPGGEALARQLIHGKRFYLEEYGIETREVWLPDSFGYSAALPQLIAASGSRWFLTQKISWNQTNRFPHHTFWWEGIDGTRVFTHFPPADTYNAEITGRELAHAQRNFAEHGYGTRSLLPFGHGDGGGGPTREMLARAARTADLEGSPRVRLDTPAEFFTAAEADHTGPAVWSGELYLEFHRGTYTSQAKTKQGNRRSEHLLREAELWCATATIATGRDYPYEALDRLWKQVLLHQFHDILPGSSIAWVHREAQETYRRVAAELEAITTQAQQALAGPPVHPITFNAAPHSRGGVPALGAATGEHAPPPDPTRHPDGTITIDNGLLRATIDQRGLLTSVYDHAAEREALAAPANLLQLHRDHPNAWDAWDLDGFYRHHVQDLTDVEDVSLDEHAVHIRRRIGDSTIDQRISVPAHARRVDITTDVDWHETEKILKAAFPLDVHADRSAAETQFGHVMRPTHTNTSWDAAKFEICAHRYLHVGEPGYGHALINDSTYGHDVTRDSRPDGTTTTVRLSLLRAPRFPDPDTDHGRHRLRYALLVGADIGDAVREGYQLNLPERTTQGSRTVAPLITVDNDAVVVEAVKLADDRSGDLVVRLYESRGGRARARLTTSFPATAVTRTDLLERPLAEPDATSDALHIRLRPFEIRTLRFTRAT